MSCVGTLRVSNHLFDLPIAVHATYTFKDMASGTSSVQVRPFC